jgi:DNA (cytosine-5)-methyltransferase 1
MRILDLFAGIGGFSYASHFLGIGETTQFVEINPYCQKVLSKNFPDIPIHDDITTYNPVRGQFDIITFGSPCQDVSTAGKQEGIYGDRSGLFFHAVRIVKQVQPKGFIMENVIGIRAWQKEILNELQTIGGYNLYWFSISVKELGGCHKRERWFCIGWRNSTNTEGLYGQKRSNPTNNSKDKRQLYQSKQYNGDEIRSELTGCDRMGRYADVADSKICGLQEIGGYIGLRTELFFDGQNQRSTSDSNPSRKIRNATKLLQSGTATQISSCSESAKKETISRICGKDDGISRKLDCLIDGLMTPEEAHQHIKNGTASDERDLRNRSKRIQALGNAVTPQQAGICFYLLSKLMCYSN